MSVICAHFTRLLSHCFQWKVFKTYFAVQWAGAWPSFVPVRPPGRRSCAVFMSGDGREGANAETLLPDFYAFLRLLSVKGSCFMFLCLRFLFGVLHADGDDDLAN